MAKLLITLTPLEPYFLGGERIFEKGDGNKHYYIRSLDTPAQSTLFGILRYMAIATPGIPSGNRARFEENQIKHNSGVFRRGFCGYALNKPDVEFHNINGISPLYLKDQKGAFWIPTPFDHQVANVNHEVHPVYTPFKEYASLLMTVQGERCFPNDYNAKDGIADSWLCLENQRVRGDLFESVPQVGIDTHGSEQAFYKKEYKRLKAGFSFAFFADIDSAMSLHNPIVYIGQGKSSFSAQWEVSEEPQMPNNLLRPGIVYAQSDSYYTGDIQRLYNQCKFVCVQTRPHRLFKTNYLDRTESQCIQLIRAGSVFLTDNPVTFAENFKNKHAEMAGFNRIITGGNNK